MGFSGEVSCFAEGGRELNKSNTFSDLNERVRQQMKVWRAREASVEELLKKSDELADVNPLLGIWSLFDLIRSGRRLYGRYLRSRFGYKVGSKDFNSTRVDRLIRPERMYSNDEEFTLFVLRFAEWAAYEGAFIMLMPDLQEKGACTDQDTYRAWRAKCRCALLEVYGATIAKMRLSKSYADKCLDGSVSREPEIIWFSGWVGAQISLGRNRRLNYSLEEVSTSARTGLLQELPATTLIELDRLVKEGKQPSKLRNYVTQHLEKAGSQAAYLQREGKLATDDLSDAATDEIRLEEFMAKERLEALRASANLSTREDQVLELMLKDLRDREIASNLGIAEGSVKTLKHRVREKLKGAAGH